MGGGEETVKRAVCGPQPTVWATYWKGDEPHFFFLRHIVNKALQLSQAAESCSQQNQSGNTVLIKKISNLKEALEHSQ